LDERTDALGHVFENTILIDVLAEDTVKNEDLPAARGIYRES